MDNVVIMGLSLHTEKMNFRLAVMQDLPQLKAVYRDIIRDMDNHRLQIWDEIYPCDFFEEDIKNNRLYLLLEDTVIVSAFALCEENDGEKFINWENKGKKALYLDRLGVNVNYSRRGMGSLMLARAKETAKAFGAEYLRLFVVDINGPAIRLYDKNGFSRAGGVYSEAIEEDFVLRQYGYEAGLS